MTAPHPSSLYGFGFENDVAALESYERMVDEQIAEERAIDELETYERIDLTDLAEGII